MNTAQAFSNDYTFALTFDISFIERSLLLTIQAFDADQDGRILILPHTTVGDYIRDNASGELRSFFTSCEDSEVSWRIYFPVTPSPLQSKPKAIRSEAITTRQLVDGLAHKLRGLIIQLYGKVKQYVARSF